jgi:hypothetical protein
MTKKYIKGGANTLVSKFRELLYKANNFKKNNDIKSIFTDNMDFDEIVSQFDVYNSIEGINKLSNNELLEKLNSIKIDPSVEKQTKFQMNQSSENKNMFPKENDSLDAYILNIMLETNMQDGAEIFTRNKLVVSKNDEQDQTLKVSLTDHPFFTYKYRYPLSYLQRIGNYKDRINIFFNEGEFNRVMSKGDYIDFFENEEDLNTLMEENIMIMLEILFPTKFPVIDNLDTSYDYVTLSSSYKPLSFNKTKYNLYSHLKVNNKEYTIKKVTFYNDLINHPLYYQLIYKTYLFQDWAFKNDHVELLQKTKKILSQNNKYKTKFPLEYLNYENSTLLEYRYPNRIVNNIKFQNLIKDHESVIDKDDSVKNFHKLIRYLYKRYFQGQEITNSDNFSQRDISDYEDILKGKGGICDINMKKTGIPTKEIYIRLNLHDEKIDDDNVDSIKCKYYGEEAGEKLQKMLLGIPIQSYFVKKGMVSSDTNTASKSSSNQENNITQEEIVESIQKIDNYFADRLNNPWREAKGALSTERKLQEILDNMRNSVVNVQDSKYNAFKVISFDTRNIIEYIFKNKYLPENINNVKVNRSLGSILNKWATQMKKPYQYEKLTELLIDIDEYLSTLNSMRSRNKINLNELKRKNDPKSVKYENIYKYQSNVLDLYEFITIYVVYNSLVTQYKDDENYEVQKNKYAKTNIKGGKNNKTSKYKQSNKRITKKK